MLHLKLLFSSGLAEDVPVHLHSAFAFLFSRGVIVSYTKKQ